VNEEEIDNKVREFISKKLKVEDARLAPEIGKKKRSWSPGLLREVIEVKARAADQSMIVRLDGETQETIGWRYTDRAIASRTVNLSKEEAFELAESEIEIPFDAEIDSVELLNRGTPGKTYSVKWKHIVDGLEVEGDFIVVKINPRTGEVISVTKNWSVVT